MPGDKLEINTSALVRTIVLVAIIIFGTAGWFWWHSVQMSSNNVFWGMINNNLATGSVTRHLTQTAGNRSLDQYIRAQFGAVNASESTVVLKQTDSSGTSVIKSDTIGTPQNDFSKYTSISTPQKTSKGKPIDASQVINIWGKSPDPKPGEKPNVSYFQQSILTLVPYGNFNQAQRKSLINQMHNQNVYDLTKAMPKSENQNGRAVFVYQVSVNPSAYVELMQAYAKDLGLGDIGLDPSSYANSPPLTAELTVDKLSRQLIKIDYPTTGQSEAVVDQGLEQPISLPTSTIPISDLQKRIQKVVQ